MLLLVLVVCVPVELLVLLVDTVLLLELTVVVPSVALRSLHGTESTLSQVACIAGRAATTRLS